VTRADFDTSVPHIARIYDFWLGGTHNFEADREAGRRAAEANPVMLQGVHGNRAFLARAVRYLAAEVGLRQFLDIGAGIPGNGSTHEVAREAAGEPRVVYVDHEPVVLAYARELLGGECGRTDYVDVDACDTEKMLEAAARILDFRQPVGVMMTAVLHCVPDSDDPWAIVRKIVGAVPPGSYLALTHPTRDFCPEAAGAAVSRLNEVMPGKLTFRPREQVLRFFGGLDLVEPGLVRTPEWRPDSPETAANPAQMWGGVARKP
jgi:S-adenosyl methyltransferase